MTVPVFPFSPTRRRDRRGAFALVITLLILSLLIVVAVSYLSSMVSERQTADAYASKARAEQVAQAGVDSAMAMMAQSFRDFPDSATVWDTQQSKNGDGTYNEGTSLYLRAAPSSSTDPAAYALPQPNATSAPANDPSGNNPDNPACKNFVLPLISGVPNGRARLASGKAYGVFTKPMDPGVTDPVSQISTDLNVRRYGPKPNSTIAAVKQYGDVWGAVGSPADWLTNNPNAPKPVRAYWVNVTDSTTRLTGRYAFWIEDESFRTNVNSVNLDNSNQSTYPSPPLRADNSADGKTVVDAAGVARSILPRDAFFSGALDTFAAPAMSVPTFDPIPNSQTVLNTRDVYPGKFLPEPLAFTHVANGTSSSSVSPLPTPAVEGLRYLTTTQSGTLNLTRHGTQRLNLNATTTIDATKPVTMPEIRKLVETLRFHLPNWGQRFYRTTNPDPYPQPGAFTPTVHGTVLNKATDVSTGDAEIYLYKTAANLRDYVDKDDLPTMIVRPGADPAATSGQPSLAPAASPTHPFGGDGQGGDGYNYMWAQGKEGGPFIQEAVVRYRPSIQIVGTGATSEANYTLSVDYYVEFWNMSDHDIKATDLGPGCFMRISAQQPWVGGTIERNPGGTKPKTIYTIPVSGSALGNFTGDSSPTAGSTGPARDFNLALSGTVYNVANPTVPIPTGVVFKAGTATVITTDPDSLLPGSNLESIMNSRYVYSGKPLVPMPYNVATSGFSAANVYYCPVDLARYPGGKRTFKGPTNIPESTDYLRGIMPDFRGPKSVIGNVYLDYEVEVTLGNDLGYIDCALGAFAISAGSGDGGTTAPLAPEPPNIATNGYDFTWTNAANSSQRETHNDYLHGGTLAGNTNTASELGDPRTNNEQLYMVQFAGVSFTAQPDQSRYGAAGVGDVPPFTLGLPNNKYVKPTTLPNVWGDYFDWNSTAYPTTTLNVTTAPSVVANSPLTSIGQLGDLFDPSRVIGSVGTSPPPNIIYSRGGGRTLKIGQRDDRFWYDPTTNATNNTADNVAASNGWASWRLTDVFSIDNALELPARININGVARDGGAALRAALTGFKFQPQTQTSTQADGTNVVKDALIHGTANLAGATLKTLPTDTTGVSKLVNYIKTRLAASAPGGNTPYGPFFERGELGELETAAGVALFGKNVTSTFVTSTDLAGTGADLNHTFDRGREELFRRLVELTCTRGDTFTVYVVGQSITQSDPNKIATARITGTHRMRVTFRLVPKRYTDKARTTLADFHPGYTLDADNSVATPTDFDPEDTKADPTDARSLYTRFAKPDLYDVQILEVNTL